MAAFVAALAVAARDVRGCVRPAAACLRASHGTCTSAAVRRRPPSTRLDVGRRAFFASAVPVLPARTGRPQRAADLAAHCSLLQLAVPAVVSRGCAAAGVGVLLETLARFRVQQSPAGRRPRPAALAALIVALLATELPYSALGPAVSPMLRIALWASFLVVSAALHVVGLPAGSAFAQALSRLALPGLLLHLALRGSPGPAARFFAWILYPLLGFAGPALLARHVAPALRGLLPQLSFYILDGRGDKSLAPNEDEEEAEALPVPAGGADWRQAPAPADTAEAVRQLEAAGATVYPPSAQVSTGADWGEFVGYAHVKAQVEESLVSVFQHASLVRKIAGATRGQIGGPAVPRAVLFQGKPGVGKTLCARILARRCAAHMVYLSAEMCLSKWHGESEANLSRLFKLARALGDKVFVFVDEIDSLVVSRDAPTHEGPTEGRLLSILLRQLDGFDSAESHCVLTLIGATNRRQDLDEALTSRFEVVVEFGLPDASDRREILKEYARHLSEGDLGVLVGHSEGLSARNMRDAAVRAERRLVYELARGALDGPANKLAVRDANGVPLPSVALYKWALSETRLKEGTGEAPPSRSLGFHFEDEFDPLDPAPAPAP